MTVLAVLNQERGTHSGGFFNGQAVCKDASIMSEVVGKYRHDWVRPSPVLLGHTRLATTGAVNKTNAHPYEFSKIVGAHNGIIYNDDELKEEYKLPKKLEVDSQILFAMIDKFGIEGLKKCSGSVGAWWFEKETQVVNLVSHQQEVSYARWKGSIFFSSSGRHLKLVLPKAQILAVRENEWLKIKPNGEIESEIIKNWENHRTTTIVPARYYKGGFGKRNGRWGGETMAGYEEDCGERDIWQGPQDDLRYFNEEVIWVFCPKCQRMIKESEYEERDEGFVCLGCNVIVPEENIVYPTPTEVRAGPPTDPIERARYFQGV